MRFDVKLHSPTQLTPFELFYGKKIVVGRQEGPYLSISFVEYLPRKLIDDISWSRKNSERYVYGYIFNPLNRVNEEMLRQRYEFGNFLVNSFSFFNIITITLTNIETQITDEIISMPWPIIFSSPPYTNSNQKIYSEVFIRDYIDAWNDFFRYDYDNCVKKLITSIENAFLFYKVRGTTKYPWWNIMKYRRRSGFRDKIESLLCKNDLLSHKVLKENLIFLYKVRNRVTHESLRVNRQDGWWFCGKGLETLQYFYQFIDGGIGQDRASYIFKMYGFADLLFHMIRGNTVENIKLREKSMENNRGNEDLIIRTPQDMDKWKFNALRITNKEKICILKNKPRE